MSLRLKLCLMVSFIYLCQFVESYRSRKNIICTKYQIDETTGYTRKLVTYCCDGYKQNTGYKYILKCDPVCYNGCPNGRCIAPEICICDVGYTMNPVTHNCEPSCLEPCYNGDCVAPELCECRPGFGKYNDTYCEPIPPLCSPSCFNGDCVGMNKCQCHDGYHLSGWVQSGFDYTCLPHTTTSTATTRAVTIITSTDDVKEETSSETTTEASSSYRSPEVTNQDQVVTDQDASHRADDAEAITEPEFTTEDVNEVTTSETNITNILFGFTELDDNSLNDENTKDVTKMWIYISAAILLVALVIMLAVAYRRRLLGYIKGRTYVVQGQETRRTSVSSRNFNVTFSSNSNGK